MSLEFSRDSNQEGGGNDSPYFGSLPLEFHQDNLLKLSEIPLLKRDTSLEQREREKSFVESESGSFPPPTLSFRSLGSAKDFLEISNFFFSKLLFPWDTVNKTESRAI